MQREAEPRPSRRQSSHRGQDRTDTRSRAAFVLRGMDAADYRPQSRDRAGIYRSQFMRLRSWSPSDSKTEMAVIRPFAFPQRVVRLYSTSALLSSSIEDTHEAWSSESAGNDVIMIVAAEKRTTLEPTHFYRVCDWVDAGTWLTAYIENARIMRVTGLAQWRNDSWPGRSPVFRKASKERIFYKCDAPLVKSDSEDVRAEAREVWRV